MTNLCFSLIAPNPLTPKPGIDSTTHALQLKSGSTSDHGLRPSSWRIRFSKAFALVSRRSKPPPPLPYQSSLPLGDPTTWLPAELWFEIGDDLEIIDVVRLSLANRQLSAYFTCRRAELDLPANRDVKYALLETMELAAPKKDFWLCCQCVGWHHFSINSPNDLCRQPPCSQTHSKGTIQLWPGKVLGWHALQLAIRAHKLGPEYGVPLEMLNRISNEDEKAGYGSSHGKGHWRICVEAAIDLDDNLLLEITGERSVADLDECKANTPSDLSCWHCSDEGLYLCPPWSCTGKYVMDNILCQVPQSLRLDCHKALIWPALRHTTWSTISVRDQTPASPLERGLMRCHGCESNYHAHGSSTDITGDWTFKRWVDLGKAGPTFEKPWYALTHLDRLPLWKEPLLGVSSDLDRQTVLRFHHAARRVREKVTSTTQFGMVSIIQDDLTRRLNEMYMLVWEKRGHSPFGSWLKEYVRIDVEHDARMQEKFEERQKWLRTLDIR